MKESSEKKSDSGLKAGKGISELKKTIKNYRPIFDKAPKAVFINELVQAQKLAQHHDSRFRAVFQHSAIGMAVVSLEGTWLEVNHALCEMTGYAEEELLSTTFQELTHEDDLDDDLEHLQQLINGQVDYYRCEKRYRHKNGSVIWVNLNVAIVKGADSIPMYLVSQIENISARKASEERLLQSEANLKSMFESANVFYILLDDQLRVVTYNQHFKNEYEGHTGFTVKKGISILDITLPAKRTMVEKMLRSVLTTRQPIEYDTDYLDKEPPRYLTATVTPVMHDGKAIGVCMAVLDVSARKIIEIEKQKIINDLLQRNRDLEQFSHIVSHNLRGPVSTILGLNAMMNEDDPELDWDVITDGIKVSTEKLDSVIRDLHTILQVRRELSEIKKMVRFDEVVENVKGSINLIILEKDVEIFCDFSAVSEMLTVSSYIISIFYNLITNSIKYAHPNKKPELKIRSEVANGRINIYFQDNGMGLDIKKYGDRVFRLYDRFHHHIDGKGLGLFMTKTQVEVLDGTIEISSIVGEGTLFKISFLV